MTASTAAAVKPCQKMTAKSHFADSAKRPEPIQLYSAVVVVLRLHAAAKSRTSCEYCGDPWPCQRLRLACRILDGL
jgi:hypothetical protein